jgi:hypothetical protein
MLEPEVTEFGWAGLSNKDCANKTNCTYGDYGVTTCRHLCAICVQLQKTNRLLQQLIEKTNKQ